MNEASGLMTQLIETYRGLLTSIIAALPRVLTGIVLVVVAFLIAKIVERVLRFVLTRLKFDDLLGRVGMDSSLQKMGVTQSLNVALPRVVFYLLLFLFAQSAAQALGLQAISDAIGGFLAYLPNVVAALLLVIVGSLGGQFAGSATSRAAREAGIDYAGALGNLVSMLILFIAGIMALSQLKIHTDIIRLVTLCTLAGLALAFGLSFGLGTRDITRNIVAGFYARTIFRTGEEIEIRGERGVLKAITPTQALIEREDRTVVFSNGTFRNPMIVRIASFAYQKGFGGHFHNDNSITALRDIPGLVVACPSRGDDAVGMLRTCMALAQVDGRVVLFLEPIALYMTKDLYAPKDGGWQFAFPPPEQAVPFGHERVYEPEHRDLAILTFGNGVPLSLRAARTLRDEHQIRARVVDLRWLAPLNEESIVRQANECGRVLVVDEGRRSGGLSEAVITTVVTRCAPGLPLQRVVGEDTYIPLGPAALHMLPNEKQVVEAARALARSEAVRAPTNVTPPAPT